MDVNDCWFTLDACWWLLVWNLGFLQRISINQFWDKTTLFQKEAWSIPIVIQRRLDYAQRWRGALRNPWKKIDRLRQYYVMLLISYHSQPWLCHVVSPMCHLDAAAAHQLRISGKRTSNGFRSRKFDIVRQLGVMCWFVCVCVLVDLLGNS